MPYATRKLATDVLERALRDAGWDDNSNAVPGLKLKDRAYAAAWLASGQARKWCDIAGLEQTQVLCRTHWREAVEDILERGATEHDLPWSSDVDAVLREGVDYVDRMTKEAA